MSCNPSVGGLAKGILVREVDALDGLMVLANFRITHCWTPNPSSERRCYACRGSSKLASNSHVMLCVQNL